MKENNREDVLSLNGLGGLLIDMQGKFLSEVSLFAKRKLIAAQIKVIRLFAKKDIPLCVLEFSGNGSTVEQLKKEIGKIPRKRYLEKWRDDGFCNSDLSEQLRVWNISNILIMGVNAGCCVKRTAFGAIDNGFNVTTSGQLIANGTRCSGDPAYWFLENGTYFDGPICI